MVRCPYCNEPVDISEECDCEHLPRGEQPQDDEEILDI